MNKKTILFLLLFGFMTAFFYAAVFASGGASYSEYTQPGLSHSAFEHIPGEKEKQTVKDICSAPTHHLYPKMLESLFTDENRLCAYVLSVAANAIELCYFYEKKYLSHIYPTHGFW